MIPKCVNLYKRLKKGENLSLMKFNCIRFFTPRKKCIKSGVFFDLIFFQLLLDLLKIF